MMTTVLQGAALAIVTAVLCTLIRPNIASIATVLSIGCAGMLFLLALRFLEPVTDLVRVLQSVINADGFHGDILLRAVGIGLLSDFSASVCDDAGESTLGKLVRLIGSVGTLSLAVPLLTEILKLLESLMNKGV